MILFSGFRSIFPIHFHFLLSMLSSIRLCCVLSHSSSFEVTSGQRIFRSFLRHLLINVCNFLISSFVDLQVSEPYRRADLTFVLKILSFVCNLCQLSFPKLIPPSFADSQDFQSVTPHFCGQLRYLSRLV